MLYRRQCLVHRAELLRLRGAWTDALEELDRALARLAVPALPRILGAAAYTRAEIHRLRGEFAATEEAYREAGEHGHEPQPWLALLRLVQGRTDEAAAAIRGAEQEAEDPLTRVTLLGPTSYEAARSRVQIAFARRALGDGDSADMDLDAAKATFDTLGATPDATVVAIAAGDEQRTGDLTVRELEVLALVARGSTHRQIADQRVISEKTVASHVGHIFSKLGLSSHSDATAYAYEHGLT